MAKVALLDEFREYCEMLAALAKEAGHEVFCQVREEGPIDFEALMTFGPQVITLALDRAKEAFSRPIGDPSRDIFGYQVLNEMEQYPAIQIIPIVLVGHGLLESDIPTTINYDLFLTLPDDIKDYVPALEELATKVKTRRKISGNLCPHCRSRLTFSSRLEELFCPRCHTVVILMDGGTCLATTSSGVKIPCTMEMLRPPSVSISMLPGHEESAETERRDRPR